MMILYTQKHRIPFQIDESDYYAVRRHTWHLNGGYLKTHIGPTYLTLHTFLLGPAGAGLETDHINRDKLDNRRENLRFVTTMVNQRNVGLRANNVSGVTGVSWYRATKKWQVSICTAGQSKFLGHFLTIEAATAARLAAEDELWGEER